MSIYEDYEIARGKLNEIHAQVVHGEGVISEIQRRIDVLKREQQRHLDIMDMIPKSQAIVNGLYDRIAGNMIRACEGAISDATQEIIADGTRIGMDIGTQGSDISVKIGSIVDIKDRNSDRILRSIMDNEGGGLTNIVCFALRAIVISRSGQRRFMVIDEPDCWLDNGKIDAFFNVVHRMATDSGYQIIALTHHDTTNFEDRANILTISRDEHGVSHIEQSGETDPELSCDDIIESIRLRDFGGHDDLTFNLAPGLNFIRGPSNIGKSRILRALHCVLMNKGDREDVSTYLDGSGRVPVMKVRKQGIVDIVFDGGRKLTYIRQGRQTSPVQTWELHEPDGDYAELPDGTICSPANTPNWAGSSSVLNIREARDGLCAQLQGQKTPVFGLDRSGPVLASLLSIGKDAGILREMLAQLRNRERETKTALKMNNAELESLGKEMLSMSHIKELRRVHDELSENADGIDERLHAIAIIRETHDEYRSLEQSVKIIDQFLDMIPAVPDIVDVDGVIETLEDYVDLSQKVALCDEFINLVNDIRPAEDVPDFRKINDTVSEYHRIASRVRCLDEFLDMHRAVSVPEIVDVTLIHGNLMAYRQCAERVAVLDEFMGMVPGIPEIDGRIEPLQNMLEQYIDEQDRLDGIDLEIRDIVARQKVNDREILDLERRMGKCPTCGRSWGHSH